MAYNPIALHDGIGLPVQLDGISVFEISISSFSSSTFARRKNLINFAA
jgi:hypothetical protein